MALFGERPPPMPVILGAPRSGTTLLRLMLDANPELAIGPETGFLPALGALREGSNARERVYSIVTNSPSWVDFGIDKQDFQNALTAIEPFSVSEACRCFYRLYASKFGKRRYGDKTPIYSFHIPSIDALLPEAHFVHLIRDGRDVALSLRTMWFSPGSDMQTQAESWAKYVRSARRTGAKCKRYIEVHYEHLILDTENVLKNICEFLNLPYHPCMLDYHLHARARLDEHQGRRFSDGTVLTKEQRLQQQSRAMTAPQADLISRWKAEMTEEEKRSFMRSAGHLLEELGYP